MPEDDIPEVEIIGASKLVDVYGFWISFHDACVETVLVERVGPAVTIQFTTCDATYDGSEWVWCDQVARVVMRWHQVRELRLAGVDPEGRNWINGLKLTSQGDEVRSELELMDGFEGVIVARQVEVVEVEALGALGPR